jgi:hypothetical protein
LQHWRRLQNEEVERIAERHWIAVGGGYHSAGGVAFVTRPLPHELLRRVSVRPQLCPNYFLGSSCLRGAECSFAHSLGEVHSWSALLQQQQQQTKRHKGAQVAAPSTQPIMMISGAQAEVGFWQLLVSCVRGRTIIVRNTQAPKSDSHSQYHRQQAAYHQAMLASHATHPP